MSNFSALESQSSFSLCFVQFTSIIIIIVVVVAVVVERASRRLDLLVSVVWSMILLLLLLKQLDPVGVYLNYYSAVVI